MTPPRVRAYGAPVFRALWAFSASALVGGLMTDIAYALTADFIWVDASDWLVTTGVVVGVFALIFGFVALLRRRFVAPPLAFAVAITLIWLISAANMMIHTRDAWTAVMPGGLALSALTTALILLSLGLLRRAPRPADRLEQLA